MVKWREMEMSEIRKQISALLRTEFSREAATGFSKLRRIPSTQVIRFMDYFTGLAPAEMEALLEALAHFNSAAFFPELAGTDIAERQQHPVFGTFMQAMAFQGFGGGYRYTPVKLLAGIAKDATVGGIEGWIKQMGFTGLALEPREDLLPNLDCLNPIPPAKLRKLIDSALTNLFDAQKTKIGSELLRYAGVLGTTRIKVDLIFAPRGLVRPRQLQYLMRILPVGDFTWSYATYEGLWSLPANWDYLTEENAPRSIELLAELVTYLTDLAMRVRELMKG